MAAAIWAKVAEERQALVDDLESITEAQWNAGSLCDGWTVRDTLAHMTATAKLNVPKFFGGMLGSGFSITKMQEKAIAKERGVSGADALERFRDVVSSTSSPPGPKESWLGEALIHSEDIRRALGIERAYPTETSVQVADFYKGSNLIIGAKKRISGLHLQASDTAWSHGSGPTVDGPILSLVMAMTGRSAHLDDLSGDGVDELRSRD